MSNPETQPTAFFFSGENMPVLRGLLSPCGSLWFVAIDALAVVGCGNTPNAMKRFEPSEWRQVGPDNPLGLHPHTRIISHRALGKLVSIGRKADAADAARWVFDHVLPTAYTLRPASPTRGAHE